MGLELRVSGEGSLEAGWREVCSVVFGLAWPNHPADGMKMAHGLIFRQSLK